VSESFDLEAPEHFTAGAVGEPGQRVFYLQARQGRSLVTLKCEKEQVGALGEYLAGLLVRIGRSGPEAQGEIELVQPIDPAWAVGSLGVGHDESDNRIIVVANEAVEEAEEDDAAPPAEPAPAGEPATARFHITVAQAAAFVARARALLKAGRPVCPMCGRAREPEGHVCPRANGHARQAQ
jgi:uncharacterized repeat protein (TIGR03847 family)